MVWGTDNNQLKAAAEETTAAATAMAMGTAMAMETVMGTATIMTPMPMIVHQQQQQG
jgi:hypothetical protein